MEINWQDIFYFSLSLTMIAVLIINIILMRLLYIASKSIKNLKLSAQKLFNVASYASFLKKGISLNVLRFLLKIAKKGVQNE